MLKPYNCTFETFITIHKNRDLIFIMSFPKMKNILSFTFKLQLLVKVIRLKFVLRKSGKGGRYI